MSHDADFQARLAEAGERVRRVRPDATWVSMLDRFDVRDGLGLQAEIIGTGRTLLAAWLDAADRVRRDEAGAEGGAR